LNIVFKLGKLELTFTSSQTFEFKHHVEIGFSPNIYLSFILSWNTSYSQQLLFQQFAKYLRKTYLVILQIWSKHHDYKVKGIADYSVIWNPGAASAIYLLQSNLPHVPRSLCEAAPASHHQVRTQEGVPPR